MARIAIGGFEHETNTFAPSKATYEDFARPGAWPGLTRGPALLEAVSGINLPIAGFIDQARQAHHALLPLSWAQATPAAEVTEEAFERIVGQIIEDLRDLRHLDAVYLDLHGAMVAEHLEDGEGEILARVRRAVGPDLPVVVGETGNGGNRVVRGAQEAATKRPEFKGTVAFVPTFGFRRPKEESPNVGHGHHWFGNAESYFLIGDAFGKAMKKLLGAER